MTFGYRPFPQKYTCLIIHLQECELEELVKHGLRALRDTLPNEVGIVPALLRKLHFTHRLT